MIAQGDLPSGATVRGTGPGADGRPAIPSGARKVLVIGPGGAGKSTLGAAIGARIGLPVVHLDALCWRPGWVPTPNDEWDRVGAELAARDAWVMDGNYFPARVGHPSRRRVSARATIFHPAAVRASWKASTPQWLNWSPT